MSRARSRTEKGHVGMPWNDPRVRLLRVEAVMQQGAALHPWWPAPLDGLMSSVERRRRLGVNYGAVDDRHVDGLPLVRIGAVGPPHGHTRLNHRWVWAATCAEPLDVDGEDVHWWHRRFNHTRAEQIVGSKLPPLVRANNPRYAARMPLVTTVCRSLQWWCIGDPQQVRGLCDGLWAIGKKHASGEGAVLRWIIEDHGSVDTSGHDGLRVLVTDPGTPARPVPRRAAPAFGLTEPDTVLAPYRPPYWRPPQAAANGVFRRKWPQVIAPWVQLSAAMLEKPT